MLAESKGLVVHDYRMFWTGPKGDIENRYTTNKHRLLESLIEDMCEAYKLRLPHTRLGSLEKMGWRAKSLRPVKLMHDFSNDYETLLRTCEC
jgi:hypothetical protein